MNLFTLRVNLSLKNSQKTFGSSMVKMVKNWGTLIWFVNQNEVWFWRKYTECFVWFFLKLSLKILYNIIGLGIYKLPQILKEWDLI